MICVRLSRDSWKQFAACSTFRSSTFSSKGTLVQANRYPERTRRSVHSLLKVLRDLNSVEVLGWVVVLIMARCERHSIHSTEEMKADILF